MSFFILLSILIIVTLNFLCDKLLDSISTSSSGEFSCSFIWGLFLCLPILAASLYLFLCIRQICKDSDVGLCQMLPVTGPGQPSVWLPLLGLFVCRKNQFAHQGWLFYALGPGKGQLKSHRAPRNPS